MSVVSNASALTNLARRVYLKLFLTANNCFDRANWDRAPIIFLTHRFSVAEEGRYYSCALDEPHVHAAVRYVEMNPVRAGIVASVEDYPWSSAKSHVLNKIGGE